MCVSFWLLLWIMFMKKIYEVNHFYMTMSIARIHFRTNMLLCIILPNYVRVTDCVVYCLCYFCCCMDCRGWQGCCVPHNFDFPQTAVLLHVYTCAWGVYRVSVLILEATYVPIFFSVKTCDVVTGAFFWHWPSIYNKRYCNS